MSHATTPFRSRLCASMVPANPSLDTTELFDPSHVNDAASPIDEFLIRLIAVNKLVPPPKKFDPLQAQLVFLGVIAAVESFLRTILRRLVAFDLLSQESTYRKEITFGAALHLSQEMLPEAVLERVSFTSKENISTAIHDLTGIKGNFPPEVESSIRDFAVICQLRHCAVHRFGKLGVGNAISLGLTQHKKLLEKPLSLDYVNLQRLIAIATGMVKTVNNFLFNATLSRLPAENWSGSFRSDKRLFSRYYDIFVDSTSVSGGTGPIRDVYDQFMTERAIFRATVGTNIR